MQADVDAEMFRPGAHVIRQRCRQTLFVQSRRSQLPDPKRDVPIELSRQLLQRFDLNAQVVVFSAMSICLSTIVAVRRSKIMHILVVDDDVRLTRHIASALTEAGHDPVIIHDGVEALQAAAKSPFDLIVLDLGLPGMDGFEVLRRLRSQHVTSRVLVLTARGEIQDRITGLQLGADDYLAKPFAMRELVARVRALGRRYAEEPELRLRVGDLYFDLANQEVYRASERIELSPRELMLLRVLMREPGRVFTRTELCERVWEHAHDYDTKLVEVFIGRLRKKNGDPVLIYTVRHVGYTIQEPIALSAARQK